MTSAALPNEKQNGSRQPLFAPWQWCWLGLQVAGLGLAAWVAQAVYQEDVSLLWRDPIGVKLVLSGGVMFLLNAILFLGGCAFVSRVIGSGKPLLRAGLGLVLAGSCFIFFYMPALFVVLNGPAAISIQRSLAGF
ncbi:MAG: hypothetical protein HY040_11885 [Planctomycetes bacterium]|nr:hypothetical protein [Planctomycetota bacterium]